MKFSLLQLLILFVPVAFTTMLISNLLEPNDIEWRKFFLADFEQTQENNLPAVIVCRPFLFWNSRYARLDEEKLSSDSSMSFVAYRHDYRYWTFPKSYDERSPEDKFVLENGGYKEPLLLLISRSGEIERIRGLSFDSPEVTQATIEFLDIAGQRRSRVKTLLCLLGLSLAVLISLSIRWRRKSTIAA